MRNKLKLLGAMAIGAAIVLFLLPKRETAAQPQPEVAASDLTTQPEAPASEPVAVAQATAPEPIVEAVTNSGQLRFQAQFTMAPARPMPTRQRPPAALPQPNRRIDADN